MKNSSLIVVVLLLTSFLVCACSSYEKVLLRDKKITQYWKSLPDCCVYEIKNNKYDGIILNGQLLSQTDKWLVPSIESILNRKIDSLEALLDDTCVFFFENQCLDSSYISESPLYIVLQNNRYYRQYLGIILDGNKYMFVSFQRSSPYCKNNNRQSEYCYQVFRLIYSRIFLTVGIDYNPKDNERFWMLYNIDNKDIHTYPSIP